MCGDLHWILAINSPPQTLPMSGMSMELVFTDWKGFPTVKAKGSRARVTVATRPLELLVFLPATHRDIAVTSKWHCRDSWADRNSSHMVFLPPHAPTASTYSMKYCAPHIGVCVEKEGSKQSWEKLHMILLAGTLCSAVPEEGWKEECSPPGLRDELKAGKQLLDTVYAAGCILESRDGKETLYWQSKLS